MGNCIKMELPAVYFEEAFPIGNGFLGGMYYGGADSGKVSLNLDSLWSGNGKYKGKTNAAQYFPELIDLVKDNKKSEAVDLLKKHFYGNDSEGFLPLGNLFVTSPEYSEFRNYERELDFNEGTAKSSYIQDANSVNEKIFCSYPDRALIYRIECKNSSLIRRIKFEPSFQCNVKYDCGKILCDGACPDGCNPIKITGNNGTIRYGCAFKIITDGCAENSDGISISGASYIEVRFSGSTSFYETDILAKKVYERLESISENYEEIYVRHIDDFKCLYNKSSLTLNGDEFADRSETLFNFGKYLMISSSRGTSMPSNLQGIWSESTEPIWYCAYTMNINLQMNYWGCEKVNLSECMEPMYNFVSRLKKSGEYTAKEYFDSDGWCAFHNSDIWNMTTPVGASHNDDPTSHAWFPGAAGWLCHPVYQHYVYTQDINYLRYTAYPIMEGAVKFYLDIMSEYDGAFAVVPGASPENAYIEDGKVCKIAAFSAMDNAIVRGLFYNFIKACKILKLDSNLLNEVKNKVKKIPLTQIGSDGRIIEWDKEYEDYEETHRHISHLYFNFPEDLNKNGEYDFAIKKVLEKRGLGGTGWSIAWKINQFARLHDGETAYNLIKRFLKRVEPSAELDYSNGGGTYPNYFCAHPPFQIDGNFGVMSGIAEMLLQDNNDYIELLPALPKEWESGEVNRFRAKNGFAVSFKWKNGLVTELEIEHKTQKECIVEFNSKVMKIKVGRKIYNY